MDNNDLKKNQENYEKVEQSIALKPYFLEIKELIMTWAKHYSKHNDKEKYLYDLLYRVMIDQKLSRLQTYALVGLVNQMIYDIDCMNEDIDSIFDSFYSRINGECIKEQMFAFPDDPSDVDTQKYAWSNEWQLWQEREQ